MGTTGSRELSAANGGSDQRLSERTLPDRREGINFGRTVLSYAGLLLVPLGLAWFASLPNHGIVWFLAVFFLPISVRALVELCPSPNPSQWCLPTRVGMLFTMFTIAFAVVLLAVVPFDTALQLRVRATEASMNADAEAVLVRASTLTPDRFGRIAIPDVGTIGTYLVLGDVIVEESPTPTLTFKVISGGTLTYAPRGLDCTTRPSQKTACVDGGVLLAGRWYQGGPRSFMEQG